MKTQWLAVAALIALATVALGQDKPKGTQLKNAELNKLLETPLMIEGYSLQFHSSFNTILARGGAVFFQAMDSDGNAEQFKGRWRIQSDALCVNVNPLQGEVCRNHFQMDDASYEARSVDEGKTHWAYRIQKPRR